tara:strand:+ start:557 stop:976 length:420 start_codon:yes stop_codon:yes gene_type:complete
MKITYESKDFNIELDGEYLNVAEFFDGIAKLNKTAEVEVLEPIPMVPISEERDHVLEVYSGCLGLFDPEYYAYMATDGDGMIHAFLSEPEWTKGTWMNTLGKETPIIFLANYIGDLVYDYQDSLRTIDSIRDYLRGDSQ